MGSINLAEYVKNGQFDFAMFERDVRIMTAYLDEVLEEGIPYLPLQEQKESVTKYRQIGGGIMGLADALIKLEIRYGSKESLEFSEKVAKLMINAALQESAIRAKELGTYPAYNEEAVLASPFLINAATPETYQLVKKHGLRNAELLSIAPTGSISTMLGVSGGMEPIFQISYTRKSETLNEDGDAYYEVFTPIAREYMEKHKLTNKSQLPDFFVTSSTLDYKDRINMQSVWQTYIDAAISSTVNVPNEFTVAQVEDLYRYAWAKKLKGVTIFRDGCERAGILTTEDTKTSKAVNIDALSIEDLEDLIYEKTQAAIIENPNVCPMCGGEMFHSGGCTECRDCGYSPCSI